MTLNFFGGHSKDDLEDESLRRRLFIDRMERKLDFKISLRNPNAAQRYLIR